MHVSQKELLKNSNNIKLKSEGKYDFKDTKRYKKAKCWDGEEIRLSKSKMMIWESDDDDEHDV